MIAWASARDSSGANASTVSEMMPEPCSTPTFTRSRQYFTSFSTGASARKREIQSMPSRENIARTGISRSIASIIGRLSM